MLCKFKNQICGKEGCEICYEKTMAIIVDKYKIIWDKSNTIKPYEIKIHNDVYKLIYYCRCGKEFFTTARDLVVENKWCNKCIKKIHNKKSTENIVNTKMNNNEKKVFKCEKCNLIFKFKSLLNQHYETSLHKTGERKTRSDKKDPLVCEICKVFTTKKKNALQSHILNNHKTEKERMKEFDYYCSACRVGFFEKDKDKYENHLTLQRHKNKVLFNQQNNNDDQE